MKYSGGKASLPLYLLAVRSGLWLCVLPLLLRICSLPLLLQYNTVRTKRKGERRSLDMDRAVHVVERVCRLRFFRLPLFPRDCLRQSLVVHRTLTRMGYPAIIHFGVQRRGDEIEGHSWVSLHGKRVAEHSPSSAFAVVYSYPLQEDYEIKEN